MVMACVLIFKAINRAILYLRTQIITQNVTTLLAGALLAANKNWWKNVF